MIIHIDHLALTTSCFDDDINILEKFGYKLRFLERNVKNLNIKKQYLRNSTDNHDIALMDCINGMSMEIINYPLKGLERSIFFPKIDNNAITKLKEIQKSFSFNEICFKSYNFTESLKFWKSLGFQIYEYNENNTCLKFRSLITRSDYFVCIENINELKDQCFLDDLGFNSIALISTSAVKDRDLLKKQNFEVTSIDALELNDKKLNIFFTIGPSLELVEIIGIN